MLANDDRCSENANGGKQRQMVGTKHLALPRNANRAIPDNLMRGSLDTQRLTALVEMIKMDLNRRCLQGRPVRLEWYLEDFPELGTVETISPELILAEYEVRRRSGESVDLAKLEARFPDQAEELRRLIDQQVQESASGSVLGRLGEMIAKVRFHPLPMARGARLPPRCRGVSAAIGSSKSWVGGQWEPSTWSTTRTLTARSPSRCPTSELRVTLAR